MKLFSCDENIKTYKTPVIKIVLCCFIIVLICSRGYFVQINNSLLSAIIDIGCFLVCILSIFCIYISVADMVLLNERRTKANIDAKVVAEYGKYCSVDYILSLLESNDIIDILIISNNQLIRLGASADSRPGSSKFFDKNFYINDRDNVTIEDLKETINTYSVNGKVCVVAIDDVSPSSY